MKTVANLQPGETLITTVRKVKGDNKYQVELAQMVINPEAKLNLAALMNADDEKFAGSQPKARRAWQTGTAASIKALFGIDVASLTFEGEKQIAVVNLENPTVQGHRLVVQLEDSLTPNYNNTPKQYPKGKEKAITILTSGGKPIYQNTRIVAEKDCVHTIIKKDGEMTAAQWAEYQLANPVVRENAEAENLASGG
jgi:hypothetical protein